ANIANTKVFLTVHLLEIETTAESTLPGLRHSREPVPHEPGVVNPRGAIELIGRSARGTRSCRVSGSIGSRLVPIRALGYRTRRFEHGPIQGGPCRSPHGGWFRARRPATRPRSRRSIPPR